MVFSAKTMPEASAQIYGSPDYPDIRGTVRFFGVYGGTLVTADITGLPPNDSFHGFHIHAGGSCTGTAAKPFQDADGHLNPTKQPHPAHAGDLPPLLACGGSAFLSFYTNRFHPESVVGKTIIIHSMPDDFRTQPSGNAGEMIACGVIF